MAVNIHLSPSAGGSVSYSYETKNKIVFTLTIKSGYVCTAYRYFNDNVDTGLATRSIKGPTTVNIHGQSFDPDTYGSHNLFVYFNNSESSGGGSENTYTVRAYANSEYGGEATVEPEVYYGVSIGTNKTFTFRATAFDGYFFDYWINDKTGITKTSNPLTITATSPSEPGDYYISYTACFRLAETYKFTATVDPAGGGTVNGLDRYEQSFKEGDKTPITVEATPNEGYSFVRWRKKDTTTYEYDKVLSIIISSSQEWIAEFGIPTINVSVKIIPNGTDHGPHGKVSIRKNVTQEVFEMENSKNLLLYPNSHGNDDVGLMVTINAYDGYNAVLIRKRMDKNSGYYIVSIPSNPYSFSNTVSDGASIEVFFGCGKILYEKETGKLLEHNGKLVYCG